MNNNNDEKFMRMAIELANDNIKHGGGPFGAIIVKDGEVVGKGSNQVTNHNDPTAHAEVLAIREACKNLKSYNLSDCILYTSCEPCPMCLGAIYWARIPKIFFGNTRKDAADIGFDDDFIYREIGVSMDQRSILMEPLLNSEAISTFKTWQAMPNKTEY
ncbi:nucleoside deaminase [Alkalitalea saponilacus]|uniref:tRNA(Arg) A34 adenosine deaminase TadA n=1 Tax=Alkalitalea saponilacus TaxID=889453 RepID=A0A1T5HTB1_9BACT|nr:nucleoside deaminase [Alkalitalea saponilacus]ASB49266.1 tRNA-specific adenosine deaminase [Alkalitalea saponilacus]SKC23751.1 tRNA(Arg) A34 adenosine deaminase TadA [Alkalitalea saponilacus]